MSQNPNIDKKPKAVLAAVQLPGVSDADHEASLKELERLCTTLGFVTLGRISQKRKALATGTILGEGKLKELAAWTGGTGIVRGFKKEAGEDDEDERPEPMHPPETRANVVIFDTEITPTQLRNLEDATGVEVLDRSGVILEIFSRHARSREARLQVEIAKLAYLAPRLRASHVGGDRQGGGIGAKGAGETAHELDRRRIRDRIAELRQQLESIQHEQNTRRAQRSEVPTVALVGYTNAGKSSLMRALTGSEVLVEDKLFATLDTTVRTLLPETVPRILISDTVGFIKKLPHDLVASFRSTLDEALNASLLLFTVDASDPSFRSQIEVTQAVLGEIGATQTPSFLVLNKVDQLEPEQKEALAQEFPEAIFISTRNPDDIKRMRELILGFFEANMIDKILLIPYTQGKVLGMIRERARVLQEKHEDEGTLVTIRAPEEVHAWIEKQLTRV
ncbi:GTPase HflX [Oligoflexus tunisiensis]|uniref:GTPase HflX n=1 Tax=Oligoflexus tunisiensis TaxID=708132 RepID=UPI000AF07356|nr:GTPase HflX [Oligoflexus tunisiensis]